MRDEIRSARDMDLFAAGQMEAYGSVAMDMLHKAEKRASAIYGEEEARARTRRLLNLLLDDVFPEFTDQRENEVPIKVEVIENNETQDAAQRAAQHYEGTVDRPKAEGTGKEIPLPVLKSNFRDWYDHAFANPLGEGAEVVFERLDRTLMDRAEAFALMEAAGIPCVRHGTPVQVQMAGGGVTNVVYYADLYAHRGDGKHVLPSNRAHTRGFCSEFVGRHRPNGPSFSLCHLQVGERCWLVRYRSENDWRSNCGDVSWDIIDGYEDHLELYKHDVFHPYPIWAIDFVGMQAVDFNTAPGLTPIQGCVSAAEVVSLIAKHIHIFGQGRTPRSHTS